MIAPYPLTNLIGQEGDGFNYAMSGLDGGRLNIAACALGAAQAALDKTLIYMSERKAFGQSIDQFQALQFRLADMEISLQAARRPACGRPPGSSTPSNRTPPSIAPWPRSS
jgi:alkylation response protein AidB-like acyl-CoA dehydrogenase